MEQNNIGRQIQQYRELAGFSQEQLAEKIDRSAIFISYMERGIKKPGLETLIRLSRALNISIDVLTGNATANISARLMRIDSILKFLPQKTQMRILDILEDAISIEMKYNTQDPVDGGVI